MDSVPTVAFDRPKAFDLERPHAGKKAPDPKWQVPERRLSDAHRVCETVPNLVNRQDDDLRFSLVCLIQDIEISRVPFKPGSRVLELLACSRTIPKERMDDLVARLL